MTQDDEVECRCGARYRREVRELSQREEGRFLCLFCGAEQERWFSRAAPTFRLIEIPLKRS